MFFLTENRKQKTENRIKYRPLQHTADVAWRIWGATLADLFAHAAQALMATMTDRRSLRRVISRQVVLEAPDQEALLVEWLNRLLYLFDTEGFLGKDFQVVHLTPNSLEAVVWGEPFYPVRHPQNSAVKAATYHQLAINRTPDGWEATVVLDL